MDKLTPEAVAKHAEAHAWQGTNIGMWRFQHSDTMRIPTYVGAKYVNGIVGLHAPNGFAGVYDPNDWPGFWTPVRPDGSDMPDVAACAERAGQEYERGRADEHRRCAEIDAETGNAERRAALLREEYERGRADGRAEERAAIVAGLDHEINARRRAGSPGVSMDVALSWLERVTAGEWSDGGEALESIKAQERAMERAAIAQGLEDEARHIMDSTRDSILPTRRQAKSAADMLRDIVERVTRGEWSANP